MNATELLKPPPAESTIEIAELESLPIRELTRAIKTLLETAPKQICFEKPVFIQDSKIVMATNYGNTIVEIDLSNLLGDPKTKQPFCLNMQFYCNQKDIATLKSLATSNLTITKDTSTGEYTFGNGYRTLVLRKNTRQYQPVQLPTVSTAPPFCPPVSNFNPKELQRETKKQQAVYLFVYCDTTDTSQYFLDKVEAPNSFSHKFVSGSQSDAQDPAFIFCTNFFLKVIGKVASLTIVKDENHYWLITRSTFGKSAPLTIHERLTIKRKGGKNNGK
ncbi:MAG: hypothetical protein V2I62_07905 [Bacteroidales bacterium]|jgi:hypothetical protein|nr:hypothetical protein [Bacteroidales bacterium]